MGAVEAADTVRKFREQGQELQIRNAISNPDPQVNQKIYDEMNAHPENFPDVKPEDMDALKDHALSAVESHIKHQDWVQGQMAEKTMLVPLINKWTNTANNQFDEGKALEDVTDQLRTGKITTTQADVLSQAIKGYSTDKDEGNKKQAQKIKDDVAELFHKREYSKANSMLLQNKDTLENMGYGNDYMALLNYGDSMQRQDRSEYREQEYMGRMREQDQSYITFMGIQQAIAQGHVFTDPELWNMAAGPGQVKQGKMLPSQVDEALKMSHASVADPDYQSALQLLTSAIALPAKPTSTATADQIAKYAQQEPIQAKRQAMTLERWQQWVNAHPNEDKVAAMQEMLQPQIQQNIGDQINQIFGVPPDTGSWLKRAPGQSWQQWIDARFGAPPSMTVPRASDSSAPAVGTIKHYDNADWKFKGGDQYDQKNWEKQP
jgi:hypothetical protein